MADLEYSAEALNTINKFYRCDTLVYVEGDDDELFWATIFEKCVAVKVVAQSVGGAPALDRHIKRIIEEDIRAIAARDADFLVCAEQHSKDPRVIYTYGYSIENTLYTDAAVSQIVKLWCKGKAANHNEECSNWMRAFHEGVTALTTYDAANFLYDCGVLVTGESFTRFAKNANSPELDAEKLKDHIKKISQTISDEMLQSAAKQAKKAGKPTSAWVRGHFLASAVLKFISSRIKTVGLANKISYDALYTNAVQVLDTSFGNKQHPHFQHYDSSVKRAAQYL